MMAMQDTPLWRGLLAWVLLADTWPGEEGPELFTPAETRLSAMLHGAQGTDLRLITVRRRDKRLALGIVSPAWGLQPAADLRLLPQFIPAHVAWYDPQNAAFLSPGPYLDENRRDLLLRRLGVLSEAGCEGASAFARTLAQENAALAHRLHAGEEEAAQLLRTLAGAVTGLQGEPGFEALTERTERCLPGVNPLLQALGLRERGEVAPVGTQWLWQGIPFARSHRATGLEPIPGGEEVVARLAQEQARLQQALPAWCQRTAQRLQAFCQAKAQQRMSAEARSCLEAHLHALRQAGALPQPSVLLDWPWDAGTGSAALLLRSLCPEQPQAVLQKPFSDWVVRLPLRFDRPESGTIRTAQGCMPAPLSAPMAEQLTASAFLSLRAEEIPEGLQISFRPDAAGQLLLRRCYPAAQQATLLPEDVPHLSLWPGIRLPRERWQGYWTSLRGGRLGFSLWDGDHWYHAPTTGQALLHTHQPPNLISLSLNGQEAGVLFSAAPEVQPPAQGEALIGLDFGAVGTAAALRLGGIQEPLVVPPLQLTILGEPGPEEPFPATATGPIVSSLERLQGTGGELFADGWALLPQSTAQVAALDTAHLYADLKWNPAEGAARRLFLRQWMTQLALAAVQRGATGIAWRFALPSGMAAGARSALWELLRDLGREITEDCGVAPGSTPAAWLTEEDALAACLREEWQIHGGMLVMDLGGAHASLSLRLRGLDRAVCGCHTTLGLQNVLLGMYLQSPELLTEDLADLAGAQARQDGALLVDRLRTAQGHTDALDSCRMLLDVYLGEYLPLLIPYLEERRAQGRITVLHALLLLVGAALMTQAGVLLESVNRDATLNDHLPAEIALCLAGRGSLPLCMLPEQEQDQLARFVRMGMDAHHPVTGLRLEPSRWPKMEAALGMTAARCLVDSPVRLPGTMLRTELPEGLELRFLRMFRAAYPDACERLFPGITRSDGTGAVFLEDAERVYRTVSRRRSLRGDPEAFAAALMELASPKPLEEPPATVEPRMEGIG